MEFTDEEMATRREFVQGLLSNLDLSIPSGKAAHVAFTELPPDQASADLKELAANKGKRAPLVVSDEIKAQFGQK